MKRVLLSFLALISFGVLATPYHAHNHLVFEEVEQMQANFLLTEALRKIADLHDSSDLDTRKEIVDELHRLEAMDTFLNLSGGRFQTADSQRNIIERSMTQWQKIFPRMNDVAGDKKQISLTPKAILEMAHELIQVYQKSTPLTFDDARSVLSDSVNGPSLYFQNEKVRSIYKLMSNVCKELDLPTDELKLGGLYYWGRQFMRHTPGPVQTVVFHEVLGEGKDCATLAQDILDIVQPHLGILSRKSGGKGQLEGLAVFLGRKLFTMGRNGYGHFLTRLLQIRGVKSLDPRFSVETALARALRLKSTDPLIVYLLSVAGHNHGLELYVQKLALELFDDRDEAVRLAVNLLSSVNHLYKLVNEHQLKSKSIRGRDPLVKAARPYHFWGGALVACELVKRGYKSWPSVKVSGMLGTVYEEWTKGTSSEGMASSREDALLHDLGAKEWVKHCER